MKCDEPGGDLFDAAPVDASPAGFRHVPSIVSLAEETELLTEISALPFQPFAFHQWTGKRETVSYGWRYDFSAARLHAAPPLPEFLKPLRERAAALADLVPDTLDQALVIRYGVGAGIGWHRDRPVFDRVVGVSLGSACVLRFRRREEGRAFHRFAFDAQPRSAYLLEGEIRHAWEHSVAPVETPRWAITFRSRR